jgi:hypothetical protein
MLQKVGFVKNHQPSSSEVNNQDWIYFRPITCAVLCSDYNSRVTQFPVGAAQCTLSQPISLLRIVQFLKPPFGLGAWALAPRRINQSCRYSLQNTQRCALHHLPQGDRGFPPWTVSPAAVDTTMSGHRAGDWHGPDTQGTPQCAVAGAADPSVAAASPLEVTRSSLDSAG